MKLTFRNLSIFFASIYMVVYTTPFFRYVLGSHFRSVGIGFLLLWTLFAFFYRRFSKITAFPAIILINILIFFAFSISGLGNINTIIAGYTAFWSYLFIFEFYKRIDDRKAIQIITIILLVVICITAITTIYASLRYPNISKNKNTDFATGLSGNDLMYKLNVGGFDYIGGMCVLSPMLLFLGFKKKHKEMLVLGVLCSICIFMSGYAIATLILAIGLIALVFSTQQGKMSAPRMVSIIIVILITTILFGSSSFIINLVETQNPHLANRLLEIQLFLNGNLNYTESDLGYRLELAFRSLNTFLTHPLFGIGPYYFVSGHGLGNHSQILDDLGRFGLIGAAYYGIAISQFKSWIKNIRTKTCAKYSLTIPYVLFLVLSMLNPTLILPILGLVLFFVLPGMYYLYD